jgi:hypothetical protein
MNMETNPEKRRLAEDTASKAQWKFFGPYLGERQWGTVREDYSPGGTAWDYLPHDHARSRAYRWGHRCIFCGHPGILRQKRGTPVLH